MASPQIEQGHIRIANELFDAEARVRMSGSEWQVYRVIQRQTYGWSRTSAEIPLSVFVESTGLAKPRIVEAINGLIARNMVGVRKNVTPRANVYHIQKNHELWQGVRKNVKGTEKRNEGVRKNVTKGYGKTEQKGTEKRNDSLIQTLQPITTKKHIHDTASPAAPASPSKGSRLTAEKLPPEWLAFAAEERPDIYPGKEWQIFSDYWRAQPGQKGVKVDWFATWRNWIRRTDGRHSRKEAAR